jgi:hypothetical protein
MRQFETDVDLFNLEHLIQDATSAAETWLKDSDEREDSIGRPMFAKIHLLGLVTMYASHEILPIMKVNFNVTTS